LNAASSENKKGEIRKMQVVAKAAHCILHRVTPKMQNSWRNSRENFSFNFEKHVLPRRRRERALGSHAHRLRDLSRPQRGRKRKSKQI
jgi:hypothetical protein